MQLLKIEGTNKGLDFAEVNEQGASESWDRGYIGTNRAVSFSGFLLDLSSSPGDFLDF